MAAEPCDRWSDEVAVPADLPDEELLDIDAALQAFAKIEPDKAELVKLRYFVGLSETDAADTLGISRATASRHWTYATSLVVRLAQTAGTRSGVS